MDSKLTLNVDHTCEFKPIQDLPASAGPGRVEKNDIQPIKPLSGFKTAERVFDTETPSEVTNPDGGFVNHSKHIFIFVL